MQYLPARWLCLGLLLLAAVASAAETPATTPTPEKVWTLPPMKLPDPLKHPCIAATPEELDRLKAALKKGSGDAYASVMERITAAQKAATQPLEFPVRGGQHNQWYQCDKCQIALNTVDSTHHRCPKCNTIYTGAPYDDVIFSQVHQANLSNMTQCAWAWALTGDTASADFATRVLLGYAERYEAYPYHDNSVGKQPGASGGHLMEQTLNEAMMLSQQIAVSYDLMYDRLSADDRNKIETGLILPMLKNIDKNKMTKSNWQTWHNAAMVAGGAVIGDATWVEKALSQKDNGFVRQMEISVTGDGMWFENSWGYHFYTLMAMVLITEDARRLGIDLWSHPRLKKMFTLAVQYTMADGTLPRFGDDVSSSAKGNPNLMEPAYAAYKDPALLALLSEKPTWHSTLAGREPAAKPAVDPKAVAELVPRPAQAASAVIKDAGHAILRTAGPAGLSGAFTFGPFGGFHGHFDKLSFVFYGFGEELGVDPGRAKSQAYRLPIHTHWYKNTLGHNAVVVGGKPQIGVEGKLDLFTANEQFAAVRASCDKAYPGVAQTRLLVMTPEYLLVFDTNGTENTLNGAPVANHARFDWIYHGKGKTAECDLARAASKLPDNTDGAEYIQNVKTGTPETPDQAVQARIVGEKITTWLTFDAQPDTTVYTGDGPFSNIDERVPLVIVERPTGTFAAVLEPVKNGDNPTVKSVSQLVPKGGEPAAGGAAGGRTIVIVREGGKDVIELSADNTQFKLTRNGQPVLTTP